MTTHRQRTRRAAILACTGFLTVGLGACSGDSGATPSVSASAGTSSRAAGGEASEGASPGASGDGGVGDSRFARFCDDALGLYEGDGFAGVDPSRDPAAFIDALDAMNDKVSAVEAPTEIAADWSEFRNAVAQLTDGAKSLDTSDPEAFANALDELSVTVAPSQESQADLDDFMRTYCG